MLSQASKTGKGDGALPTAQAGGLRAARKGQMGADRVHSGVKGAQTVIPDETQAQQAPSADDANGQVATTATTATADHITSYNPATGERLPEIQMDAERALPPPLAAARTAP